MINVTFVTLEPELIILMDIDLLSKMVRQLILEHDKVFLPGLGAFVAEIVPSTFSDKGYTVNPPYRRLSFRTRAEEDSLLAGLYAASNNVPADVAGRIILDFTTELGNVLKTKKTVVFPGLGRLRATKENNFFFVPDEDLDIYPDGFGLEPVSLKSHRPEEVAALVSGLHSVVSGQSEVSASSAVLPDVSGNADDRADGNTEDTMADPAGETDEPATQDQSSGCSEDMEMAETHGQVSDNDEDINPQDPQAQMPDNDEDMEPQDPQTPQSQASAHAEDIQSDVVEGHSIDSAGVRNGKRLWIAVACVIGGLALLLLLYVVLTHIFPEFMNSVLYSPEELEIIRYGSR